MLVNSYQLKNIHYEKLKIKGINSYIICHRGTKSNKIRTKFMKGNMKKKFRKRPTRDEFNDEMRSYFSVVDKPAKVIVSNRKRLQWSFERRKDM